MSRNSEATTEERNGTDHEQAEKLFEENRQATAAARERLSSEIGQRVMEDNGSFTMSISPSLLGSEWLAIAKLAVIDGQSLDEAAAQILIRGLEMENEDFVSLVRSLARD